MGDKKFSAEEGADEALVAVKRTHKLSTGVALHWAPHLERAQRKYNHLNPG